MKNERKRSTRPSNGGSTLWGLFGGLVIGLAIAFGIVWYLNKSPLPFQDRTTSVGSGAVVPGAEPAPLPGKPGDKPREKTQLDFYTILPGTQPATPGNATSAAPVDSEVQVEAKPVEVFYLQAGAFQKVEDAEKLKARLALMGFDASVQAVTVVDKGVLQRVRVGPFRSVEEMNKARTTLAQGGVQTTVSKQKEQKEPPAQ